ncbi:hypothetical protein [Methanomethylophilus alvi]|uniref:hypothetical protein n=1 Tax=Methanomethylophilus alvi TaxID=1291540 RepID=UPI0037DD481D
MIYGSAIKLPGEEILREYEFLSMDFRPKIKSAFFNTNSRMIINKHYSANATLTVTNERIIYNCVKNPEKLTSSNTQMYQMHIRDVGDISMANIKWRSYWPLLFVLIGAIVLMLVDVSMLTITIAGSLLFIAFLCCIFFPKSIVYLSIGSKSAFNGFLVGKASHNSQNEISFHTEVCPDFFLMYEELGALVIDLQKNGDMCIPRWKIDKPEKR